MPQNIYNISANYNFLQSLVHFILQKYQDNPLFLAKITILLPSRRACRVIKEIFLEQNTSGAAILPNIKAIGDFDIEDVIDSNLTKNIQKNSISELKYRCLLIEEIRKFNKKTNFFGKNINSNQIDLIASNLNDFLQEIDREELDLDNLENIESDDLASHKQKILNFLRHFGSNWRNILVKNDIISKTNWQNKIIDLNRDFLEETQPKNPIFIAGTTGSLKATSRLIKTISKLENGFVILQNLDQNITPEIAEELEENHPQFLLNRLLKSLEIVPKSVQNIAFEPFKQSDKNLQKLLHYAFLPAKRTGIWSKITNLDENYIKNLTLIECKNNFDEATAIALIMVKYLQENNKTNIGIVTSDNSLANSLKVILEKFDINIDNSSSNKLPKSEFVNYLLAIAKLFNNEFKASNLLTILKNKVTKAGFEDDFYNDNLKIFELEILRKNFSLKNLKVIEKKVLELKNDDLTKWFLHINKTLEIFNSTKNEANFLKIIEKNLESAKNLSKNAQNQENLDNLTGSAEFYDFIEDLKENAPNFEIEQEIYYQLLRQFISSYSFEKKQNHHPRLHILSPIEARIMNFDVVIVANLNEGDFIAQTNTQNWLSRKMRLNFGLFDTTRKTGMSAFDFCNYLGNKKVFLTRSITKNNAPTSKLRFLLKLETLLKAANAKNEIDDGQYWHFLLEKFNFSFISHQPTFDANFSHQTIGDTPCGERKNKTNNNFEKELFCYEKNNFANPELEKRLKRISVTDISKWIRDPYYIYAKRILKLQKLNKIDEEASFANFGNFVHEVLENFIKNYEKIDQNKRLEILINDYGKKYFQKYFLNEESYLLWWSKFENIANWFVKNEENLRKNLKNSITELALNTQIEGVKITTKIDRIDFDNDNNIRIIDYKTGLIPTNSDINQGLEPQLAIESLIFLLNNENLDKNSIKSLQYYALKGRDKNEIKDLHKDEIKIQTLITAANEGIKELIKLFNQQKLPFYSCPNPDIYKENDYHHLARVDDD